MTREVLGGDLCARDWHGVERRYQRRSDGAIRNSLRALAQPPYALDWRGIAAAWGLAQGVEDGATQRTVLADICRLGSGQICAASATATALSSASSWSQVFAQEVADLAARAQAPAVALGGGLDAAAVLAAWRASGVAMPLAVTIHTGIDGYDEVERAAAIAACVGAPFEVIAMDAEAILAHTPAAVDIVETPLYNLHPVTRLVLARELRRRGYATLVTGDGADPAFAARPDVDYVPLMAALTRAANLELAAPFLADATLAATLALGPDPHKQALRAYVTAQGLPRWLAQGHKRPRLLPRIDVSRYIDVDFVAALTSRGDMGARFDLSLGPGYGLGGTDDRIRVGWATLALLLRRLGQASGRATGWAGGRTT